MDDITAKILNGGVLDALISYAKGESPLTEHQATVGMELIALALLEGDCDCDDCSDDDEPSDPRPN